MGDSGNQNLSLGEAASRFLAKLPPEDREANQQAIYKFVRWCGQEQTFVKITGSVTAGYAEQLSLSDTDYLKKLELVRSFLTYAKKAGWCETNLATHLKTKKAKNRQQPSTRESLPKTITLTRQGYAEMETELAALKQKRPQLIEEMRRAAADKDFKENAPLAAAREQRGYLEGRIKELEEAMKVASIIDDEVKSDVKAFIGNTVVLKDTVSSEELCYLIVDPREVDPTQGKISSASPIGKAIIGRGKGDIIEVTVPAGKLRYEITRIEH